MACRLDDKFNTTQFINKWRYRYCQRWHWQTASWSICIPQVKWWKRHNPTAKDVHPKSWCTKRTPHKTAAAMKTLHGVHLSLLHDRREQRRKGSLNCSSVAQQGTFTLINMKSQDIHLTWVLLYCWLWRLLAKNCKQKEKSGYIVQQSE